MIVKAHEVSVACATSSIRTPWKLKPDSFTWKDGWWHISATFVPRLPWFNPCDPQTIDGGDWIPMTSYKWPNLICAFARTLNVSNRRSPVVFNDNNVSVQRQRRRQSPKFWSTVDGGGLSGETVVVWIVVGSIPNRSFGDLDHLDPWFFFTLW